MKLDSVRLFRWGAASGAVATAIVLSGALPAAAAPSLTSLLTYAPDGTNADGGSRDPSISTDGRFVAFESAATNLIAGDTNGSDDIFVRNTLDGSIVRVSVATDGTQSDGGSGDAAINTDGRYVAFESSASNLVAGDTNGNQDSFVHDLQTGTTVRVSTATDGTEGDGYAGDPWISSNGQFVVFESNSSNLVANDTNGEADIFLRDVVAGTTVRISVDSDEVEATGGSSDDPTISADGRYVAFESNASNLVAGDTNGNKDVFVRDLQAGSTVRISVTSDEVEALDGSSGNPIISSNGKYVAFESGANDLVTGDTGRSDAFVRDLVAGTTVRVSVADDETESNGASWDPVVSNDGRYAAFESGGSNLVAGDTNGYYDIFVRDLVSGTTTRVSANSLGVESNFTSYQATISGNGKRVAFESQATNLGTLTDPPVHTCDNQAPVLDDDRACFWDVFLAGQPIVLPPTGVNAVAPVLIALVFLGAGTCVLRLRRIRNA